MAASDHATPNSRRDDALSIVRRLAAAGHIAYFAGGCVRDMLLDLVPKDFDVATDAPPTQVRKLFPRSQGVGQAFGVVLVREGKSQIEVATFRADGSYTDGRRPDAIRFATPEEDARRRDFTINGLFFDPLADRVIDTVNGIADLDARVLRAIGDPAARFAEDYLRLLRAVRFAARFNFDIDSATAAGIRANADRLPRIAPERLAAELRAMLTAPSRVKALKLLDELQITPVLFRLIVGPHASSPPRSRTLFAAACGDDRPTFALALAAVTAETLLAEGQPFEHFLSPEGSSNATRLLRQTFRLSNDECYSIASILDVGALLAPSLPRVAILKRFLARPDSADARRLLRGIAAAGVHADRIAAAEAAFAAFAPETIDPPPLITGDDLQKAGHPPGPKFKLALDAAYDAQLENEVSTRDDALKLADAVLNCD